MRHAGVLTWVRADEVKSAARRVGLDRLQQYLDHLAGTRAYDWFEARLLTAAERFRLAELVGEENLDQHEQFTTGLRHWTVAPLTGYKLHEYLLTTDLVALVKAKPFVQWYTEERQRLQRDAQLLADRARQRESIAAAARQHAEAAYVAAANYTSNGKLSRRHEADLRWSRRWDAEQLLAHAEAERRAAKWTSGKAMSIQSAAGRLGGVKSRDLALVGTALESFICREFSNVLCSVDSVAMLFLSWVDAESICCASPKCSERFLHMSTRKRRLQEYCSPACKTAAYRAREKSAQAA